MSLDFAVADAFGTERAQRDRFWARLTMSRQKWALYRDEPAFRVAHARLLAEIGPPVIDTLRAHAVLMVKPEGWIDRLLPRVLAFLDRNDFQVVGTFRTRLTPIMIREVWRYQWNIAPIERIELSELLLSFGPTYGFLLKDVLEDGSTGEDRKDGSTGEDGRTGERWPASVRLARLKGPALPERQQPGHLRYELKAPCRIVSYVHIPDEPADIIRDLSVMLDRHEMVRLLAGAADGARLDVDPGDYLDVAQIDDSLPTTSLPTTSLPIAAADSLWRRVQLMKDVFADYSRAYRIPRSLWLDLLDLCTEVSALPTPGKKRVEPLADMTNESFRSSG